MTEAVFNTFILGWMAIAAIIFISLFFIDAPYGRHEQGKGGASISDRMGWVIMELPAVAVIALYFLMSDRTHSPVALAFLFLWEFHYIYRTFIFSSLLRGNKTMPWIIVGSGFCFNIVNGYINGYGLFNLKPEYSLDWFADPRFIIGTVLFFGGFATHFTADHILRNLRQPGETGYKIPQGGLYRWVSCPNYLGEIMTWGGWALATWSLGGLAFFVWSVANLLPRTLSHHKWYQETFPDYPRNRKAVIPFIL